jgi:hypothetical protein
MPQTSSAKASATIRNASEFSIAREFPDNLNVAKTYRGRAFISKARQNGPRRKRRAILEISCLGASREFCSWSMACPPLRKRMTSGSRSRSKKSARAAGTERQLHRLQHGHFRTSIHRFVVQYFFVSSTLSTVNARRSFSLAFTSCLLNLLWARQPALEPALASPETVH